ncbi:hypothetical protein [Lacticaseibacillus zhaodongensis]|uniref:hypothetical protein n=1 Tax=Lacticaseibacillus zhaodongensis TaxID=2668065 RepID=UPI0012D2F2C6|nr:hypothetical protein [Lacticaseibacillus zhaodongensis]
MEISEEQLSKLIDQRVDERLAERSNQQTPAVAKLNSEVKAWAATYYPEDLGYSTNKQRSNLINGYRAIIKSRYDLKDIRQLTDDMVPEARALFERYKKLFETKKP